MQRWQFRFAKKLTKPKIIVILCIFLLCGAVFGAVLKKDLRQKLENIRMAASVYDRHGNLIGNLFFYRRIWMPLEKIPVGLQNAVVAIEDARFYKHNGVDLKGMARAVIKDLIPGGPMEGGSTITQQLAKIVLLSSERTLGRKIQDISYALEIEQTYTKQEILEFYLNSIYLAHGNVGVEAASRYYFGKSVSRLNLAEMALIAGIIRSPENYSPIKHPQKAKERRNLVLKKMLEHKYITESQYQAAITQRIKVVSRNETASVGAYFLGYVHDYLVNKLGFSEEDLRYGGYSIYTTLDLSYQREAERVLTAIPHYSARVQPQAAIVTLDPTNGAVLAMVGGRDYSKSQLNRAVKSYRQPGSAIKPFVYAAALEKGYTAASLFEDKQLSIQLPNGAIWSPENYDHKFRGKMNLREALRQSVNSVAVQLLQEIGVDTVYNLIESAGVSSLIKKGKNNDLNLAPLALGGLTKGVTPLELAAAYIPFANQGLSVEPFAVVKVCDSHGNVLKRYQPEKQPKPVLTPQTAYIMTMLLKDVVDQGTGIRAKLADRPAAGKTGTSSDYTNAWFVGYTPELVTAVWMGNDRQESPMSYVEGKVGSSVTAEIWGKYMSRITSNLPVTDFSQPDGIVWVNVNPETGQAVPGWFKGNSYQEVFAEKSIPRSTIYKLWHWLFPGRKPAETTVIPDDQSPEPNQAEPEINQSPTPGPDEITANDTDPAAIPVPSPEPTYSEEDWR